MALAATFGLLAALVALTVFAGPVTGWLTAAAEALYDPGSYIAAVQLEGIE